MMLARYVWCEDNELWAIDASSYGNEARFLNHYEGLADRPNVRAQVTSPLDMLHATLARLVLHAGIVGSSPHAHMAHRQEPEHTVTPCSKTAFDGSFAVVCSKRVAPPNT